MQMGEDEWSGGKLIDLEMGVCYAKKGGVENPAVFSKIRLWKEKEEVRPMWFILALLSAVFAALTSNLATAIRTLVVLVMAWGMVFLTGTQGGITEISRKSWVFLILSGLATGASWLCYYRALQLGEASKVVPIDKLSVVITLILAFVFLHEKFTLKSALGAVLITAGTLMMVL